MLDDKGFDSWADEYDASVRASDEAHSYPFAGYPKVLDGIFGIVAEKPGAAVLDLGFGTGTLTARLYESGCEVFGQDFSPRMIELAAAKMPAARLYARDFTRGLAEPLRRRRYDFIVATYALHHLTDAQKVPFIRDLCGRLADGGALLIGDVAFRTRAALEACRAQAGDDWDDSEFYFVADELREAFPGLRFTPKSFCAGILAFGREGKEEHGTH